MAHKQAFREVNTADIEVQQRRNRRHSDHGNERSRHFLDALRQALPQHQYCKCRDTQNGCRAVEVHYLCWKRDDVLKRAGLWRTA